MNYIEMGTEELQSVLTELKAQFADVRSKKLSLNMSRGVPGKDQLDLTNEMLTHCLDGDHFSEEGVDCRNYGVLDGIIEAKRLFLPMLGVNEDEIIIGGNSSLQLMYDSIARAMLLGVYGGTKRWDDYASDGNHVKFICPCPGYDRHFAICESMGIEMISVAMTPDGPDMDAVELIVSSDETVKGIWCVPMYSNPEGITYSDATVKRFARLRPKADDFRIYWDNAYCMHHLTDDHDVLLNLLDECKNIGTQDMVYIFASTSKISFPGGGLAVMVASKENITFIKKQMSYQTIGYDKLNQLRHARFFKDYDGMVKHMEKHRALLQPKFHAVTELLEAEIAPLGIGEWTTPKGGYFISFNGMDGTAKRTVYLCRQAGLVLTGAGATFPYGLDPRDRNIRIAPTSPAVTELLDAMQVFALCVKIAAAEQLLKQK
jgi:aspartate/methionine/tyrosine aminotransferase